MTMYVDGQKMLCMSTSRKLERQENVTKNLWLTFLVIKKWYIDNFCPSIILIYTQITNRLSLAK